MDRALVRGAAACEYSWCSSPTSRQYGWQTESTSGGPTVDKQWTADGLTQITEPPLKFTMLPIRLRSACHASSPSRPKCCHPQSPSLSHQTSCASIDLDFPFHDTYNMSYSAGETPWKTYTSHLGLWVPCDGDVAGMNRGGKSHGNARCEIRARVVSFAGIPSL